MCDFDRSKVTLPVGFEWNKEESIYNTDGECNSRFGGEINTPPLIYCEDSFQSIKDVYDSLNSAGGRLKWSIALHVHLFAGDLTLEQLKQLVVFQYTAYPYLRDYTNCGEWDEIALHGKPLITEKKYDAIRSAETLKDLKRVLSNESHKGFIRYAINIASYFVRKTIEFRCFNATQDMALVRNCVEATYKMFYYALNHTEEDYRNISSLDDFIEKVGLPKGTPPAPIPLIYQGNPYSNIEAFKAKPILFSAKLGSALMDSLKANGIKEIAIVNSFMFQYELNMWDKVKVRCYNQDGYSHLLYLLSTGQKRVHYSNRLSWLEELNSDDPVRQVAIALYIFKIRKFVGGGNDYKDMMMGAYRNKAEESILETEKSAKRLIKMLGSIDYVNGSLNDAIAENKSVFFSFGKYKKCRRVLRIITGNSDYEDEVKEKPNQYYNIIENLPEWSNFFMFSDSPYFSNMKKVAYFRNAGLKRDSAGRFLYCNREQAKTKVTTHYDKGSEVFVNVCEPPDDLVIDDPNKINIYEIPNAEMYVLQKRYIKKVDQISMCSFAFAIMYDKYLLGAVGFKFKDLDYDVWQLSDFCTNNNIPRLARFILICTLSRKLQSLMSRKLQRKVETSLTYVYTDNPVSMKYRGLYTKDKALCGPHKLAYVGMLGKYATMEECINVYKKYIENARK